MKRISIAKIKQKAKEWRSQYYCFLPISTCKDYASTHDATYYVLKNSEEVPVTPVRYVSEPARNDVLGLLPERYYCVLHNIDLIGASNVLVGKDVFIYDLLANKKKTYNITDRGLFRIWNSPIHFLNYYFLCYQSKGETIEKGICLTGNFSSNYYHYIYEILVKWYLLEKLDIPADVPLIVDDSVRIIPQFNELLSIFAGNRDIIYVEKYELRRVNTLYYPSMVNFIPPNLKKIKYLQANDVVFDLEAISFLRTHFLSYMGDEKKQTPSKIFISRKSSKWRQYNEDDVISVVKALGYEVVYPELMTVREQFILFNHAEKIVAASGAALSNIICCRPNTFILLLVSIRVDGTIYSTIAKSLGINLQYFVGSITNYNNVQSDFTIDCARLKVLLA